MNDISKVNLQNGTALVLGGARSGKSAFAEKLVFTSGLTPYYMATAQIHDEEMRVRVETHKKRRNEQWITIDVPLALEEALLEHDGENRILLVDCLTLWITNLMLADMNIAERSRALCKTLSRLQAPVVLVSNEVGLGIVPDNKMARDFRDYAGSLHQKIADQADIVYFIAAGLPLRMKG